MVVSLVNTMAAEWKPQQYRHEYRGDLKPLIEQNAKSGSRKLPFPNKPPRSGQVIDLLSLLQQSLGKVEMPEKSGPHPQQLPARKAA